MLVTRKGDDLTVSFGAPEVEDILREHAEGLGQAIQGTLQAMWPKSRGRLVFVVKRPARPARPKKEEEL